MPTSLKKVKGNFLKLFLERKKLGLINSRQSFEQRNSTNKRQILGLDLIRRVEQLPS
jgi:hypothetical protein